MRSFDKGHVAESRHRGYGLLSDGKIHAAMAAGAIACTPPPRRIEGAHIDVTIGNHYWVFRPEWCDVIDLATADPVDYFEYRNAEEEGDFITFPAQSFTLAHTVEFIGTAGGSCLVPALSTRSTTARWGLGIHLSAGWGDEGYATRWTLEIINPHRCLLRLPVGARVGSLAFKTSSGANNGYVPGTRYNIPQQEWSPESMLPRKGNW